MMHLPIFWGLYEVSRGVDTFFSLCVPLCKLHRVMPKRHEGQLPISCLHTHDTLFSWEDVGRNCKGLELI